MVRDEGLQQIVLHVILDAAHFVFALQEVELVVSKLLPELLAIVLVGAHKVRKLRDSCRRQLYQLFLVPYESLTVPLFEDHDFEAGQIEKDVHADNQKVLL